MMIKRKVDKFWFPWWPEKWLWGTIRIECTPAERGIWVDLLSLASKDDGHIRANEEIAYPLKQLAGMLILPEKELNDAINKFIRLGKLIKTKTGTIYVAKWDKYQFSERHKRRVEEGMSKKEAIVSKETALKNNTLNNNTLNNNKVEDNTYTEEFSQFYEYYNYKVAKKDALKAYTALRRKKVPHEQIMEAAKGYFNHLRNEEIHSNFKKAMLYPATFLRSERWKDFLGVTYKPPM